MYRTFGGTLSCDTTNVRGEFPAILYSAVLDAVKKSQRPNTLNTITEDVLTQKKLKEFTAKDVVRVLVVALYAKEVLLTEKWEFIING